MYHVSSFSGKPVFAANRFSLKIEKWPFWGFYFLLKPSDLGYLNKSRILCSSKK
jgi:hypothetical protein